MSVTFRLSHQENHPIESLPTGWETALVQFSRRNGGRDERIEIIDMRSSDPVRYLHEPMFQIAQKCTILFFIGVPLYFLKYTTLQLLRLPVLSFIHRSPAVFLKQIWRVVKIPFYFIALEFAALYGIVYPLEGRALFASLESLLHEGRGRRDSLQHKDWNCDSNLLKYFGSILLETDPDPLFLGYCMQPIGKLSDSHIIEHHSLPAS